MTSPATGVVIAASGRWHFGIGDPDAAAWCIVGAYAVAVALSAWACRAAARGARHLSGIQGTGGMDDVEGIDRIDDAEAKNQRTLAQVWFAVALVMLALGVNKQLDLQTWFLQTMRRRAYEGGWYGDRRRFQVDVIGITLLVGTFVAAGLAFLLRRVLRRILITIAGMAMLVVFVTIRAISFHFVDRLLQLGGRVNVNVILELSGILLVIASTVVWQRDERTYLRRAEARARQRGAAGWAAPRAATVDPAASLPSPR